MDRQTTAEISKAPPNEKSTKRQKTKETDDDEETQSTDDGEELYNIAMEALKRGELRDDEVLLERYPWQTRDRIPSSHHEDICTRPLDGTSKSPVSIGCSTYPDEELQSRARLC